MNQDELEPARDPLATREILANLNRLNADELEAVSELVKKLVRGSSKHGALVLDTDPREFTAEALEEIDDALWYVRYSLMRLRRAK